MVARLAITGVETVVMQSPGSEINAQAQPTVDRGRTPAQNPTTKRMGYIRGLSMEALTRSIWLRGADGKTLRNGWKDEIDKLLTTMCVCAERDEVTCGHRYLKHVFSVNRADSYSTGCFTVRVSKALETLARTGSLHNLELRNLISCTCTQYDRCKDSVPGDLMEQWPGIYRDVLCKHCVVILINKVAAQMYPELSWEESLSRLRSTRTWPVMIGQHGLGNESKDVYVVPGDGLKVGPRANFSSDYNRVEGGEIQTIYVAGDPYAWIKKLEFPSLEDIDAAVDRYCDIAREANDVDSGIRPGQSQRLQDAWHQQHLVRRSRQLKIERDPFGSPFLEVKELTKDVETGKIASLRSQNDAKMLKLTGRYWTARLEGFAAINAAEEGVYAVQCDARRAAVIGLEQALIEPKMVIYFLKSSRKPGRREATEYGCYQDLVAVMSQTIERKVRLLIVVDQDLAEEQNVLTDFLIAARAHTGVPTVWWLQKRLSL